MADATDAGWGYLANAPGFVRTSGPAVLSSRFAFEDSYTLERSLATGGYEGLRAARKLKPLPAGVFRGCTMPVWDAAARASPQASSGASVPTASGPATWSSMATRASPVPTRTAC